VALSMGNSRSLIITNWPAEGGRLVVACVAMGVVMLAAHLSILLAFAARARLRKRALMELPTQQLLVGRWAGNFLFARSLHMDAQVAQLPFPRTSSLSGQKPHTHTQTHTHPHTCTSTRTHTHIYSHTHVLTQARACTQSCMVENGAGRAGLVPPTPYPLSFADICAAGQCCARGRASPPLIRPAWTPGPQPWQQ